MRLLVICHPSPRFRDDSIRLVAEFGRKLPVGCHHLGGCVKPDLINYDLREGTYIIPKVMDSGYVELGKKRMEFSRKG
jgi:hypothetical protein